MLSASVDARRRGPFQLSADSIRIGGWGGDDLPSEHTPDVRILPHAASSPLFGCSLAGVEHSLLSQARSVLDRTYTLGLLWRLDSNATWAKRAVHEMLHVTTSTLILRPLLPAVPLAPSLPRSLAPSSFLSHSLSHCVSLFLSVSLSLSLYLSVSLSVPPSPTLSLGLSLPRSLPRARARSLSLALARVIYPHVVARDEHHGIIFLAAVHHSFVGAVGLVRYPNLAVGCARPGRRFTGLHHHSSPVCIIILFPQGASCASWNPEHFLDTAEMMHAVAVGYDWYVVFWPDLRRFCCVEAVPRACADFLLDFFR